MRVVALLLLPSLALAGGVEVDQRQSQNQTVNQSNTQSVGDTIVNTDTVVNPGDTIVGGDDAKAYAFSHGLGDVDIADCLASVQFGTILFSTQGVKLNKWCAAEIYDAKGLYKMGAMMRCDIKEVVRLFDTHDECIVANTVAAPPPPNPPEEHCDDECEDQLEQVVALEERLAVLEQKRHDDAARAQRATKEARQAREAANQAGITEAQREALAEVFKRE